MYFIDPNLNATDRAELALRNVRIAALNWGMKNARRMTVEQIASKVEGVVSRRGYADQFDCAVTEAVAVYNRI